MLPAAARLRDSTEFRNIVRHGVRVGRPTLVVHADLDERSGTNSPAEQCSTKVGFVVSKKVGNAVVRNRVKRRLRHLARARVLDMDASAGSGRLDQTDPVSMRGGLTVVVRALPAAATEPKRLPGDFVSAWDRALSRLSHRGPGHVDNAHRDGRMPAETGHGPDTGAGSPRQGETR